MSLYLFHTDLLTLYSKGHQNVRDRAAGHEPDELVTSVLTVEELLTGWYTVLRQAKNDQQLVAAYDGMTFTTEFLSGMRIVSFSQDAAIRFAAFRKARLKIKTMDLRIACVAIEAGAKLVTRNRADFEKVPGLELEDWTIP